MPELDFSGNMFSRYCRPVFAKKKIKILSFPLKWCPVPSSHPTNWPPPPPRCWWTGVSTSPRSETCRRSCSSPSSSPPSSPSSCGGRLRTTTPCVRPSSKACWRTDHYHKKYKKNAHAFRLFFFFHRVFRDI